MAERCIFFFMEIIWVILYRPTVVKMPEIIVHDFLTPLCTIFSFFDDSNCISFLVSYPFRLWKIEKKKVWCQYLYLFRRGNNYWVVIKNKNEKKARGLDFRSPYLENDWYFGNTYRTKHRTFSLQTTSKTAFISESDANFKVPH